MAATLRDIASDLLWWAAPDILLSIMIGNECYRVYRPFVGAHLAPFSVIGFAGRLAHEHAGQLFPRAFAFDAENHTFTRPAAVSASIIPGFSGVPRPIFDQKQKRL